MDYKVVIVGIYLIASLLLCSEAPTVKMTNAVCKSYNKSWVVIHYCRLKAYSRINIYLHLKMMKKASGYKPFLFDYTFDVCKFLRKPNQPFFKIIWNLIKGVSTVNHTCPYVGLQMVHDFHHIQVPLNMPSGDYLLLFDWIFNGKPQFATNVYFNFVEDS